MTDKALAATETAPPLATLRSLDVEAVRLPLEREMVKHLGQEPFIRSLLERMPVRDPQTVRRALMAQSLRLTEGMAPALFATARDALGVLQITTPLEIYQSSGRENASIHLIPEPILVEIQGRMLTLLDRGSMLGVLGHELGHYLAHGPRSPLGSAAMLSSLLANADGVPEPLQRLGSSLSMAKELTADRFGLLVCQDLGALLRLEMTCTTGLPGDALTWDTDGYLAQCRELMEQVLREGSAAIGTTHPEHNLRAYAAWLFSESDLFRALTGKGPGTRAVAEINAVLERVLRLPGLEVDYHMLDEQPSELSAFALASCVLVANADGELADGEAEAIEKVFAPLVPGYRDYFDFDHARQRFSELTGLIAAMGADTHRALFLLLLHVALADGVVDPRELGTVFAIGAALGCEPLFRAYMDVHLRRLGLRLVARAPVVAVPLPPRGGEAQSSLEAFLRGIAARGGGEVTPRRLLRLLGERGRSPDAVAHLERSIRAAGLRCGGDLGLADLDAPFALEPVGQSAAPRAPASPVALAPGTPAAMLVRGIARLRARLVSGDGWSPSVRLRKATPGRAFDLASLEHLSVGLSERVLAQVRSGGRAQLVKASEAGSHEGALAISKLLLALDREHLGRIEETGANDLSLGYPFLRGLAGGYFLQGPLVVYPVELERDERGARGFALRARKDQAPSINLPLLRVLFAKKEFALTEALASALDEAAADPARGPEAVLAELGQVGVSPRALTGALRPLEEATAQSPWAGGEGLEVLEWAVLGLFPMSSSDLLQDYDGLLHDLGSAPAPGALGAAAELLPADLRELFATPLAPEAAAPETSLGVPVIQADPSQRDVMKKARSCRLLVVDGPPGTGKSQVIVNLVAEAIGRGERVAVVSEKRAALDVVAQRLQQTGLESALALVHNVQDDRRQVYQKIAARLENTAPEPEGAEGAPELVAQICAISGALEARTATLRLRPGAGAPSLGALHALASGLTAPLVAGLASLARLPLGTLVQAQGPLLALRPSADLFAEGTLWRRERASFSAMSSETRSALEASLDRSLGTATALESWAARAPGVTFPQLTAARALLEDARESRALRARSEDQQLFASALSLASSRPEQGALLARTASTWTESDAALLRLGHRVSFELRPEAQAALGVVASWGARFFRYFSFAWWRARGLLTKAVAESFPERGGAPLDTALLEELTLRSKASRAWREVDECLDAFGLRGLSSPAAAATADLLGRLAALYRRASPLAAARSALEAIGAWPSASDAGALQSWDTVIDARLAALDAEREHRSAASALVAIFPWLGSLPGRADLEATGAAFRRDAARVVTADQRLEALGALLPEAPSLAARFADTLPGAAPAVWAESLVRTWAGACIDALESQHPEIAALDRPGPFGDEPEAARALEEALARATSLERRRIAARLSSSALVRAAPSQKGRRRTADQASREAILKECRKQRSVMPLRTFVRKFAPEGLLDLLPVWLLSPETMTVLFPREPLFDLVIFDEASQCTVQNGLPALLRSQRAVIAGDEKQMPPSSFFSARAPGEEAEGEPPGADSAELFDAESLLTLATDRAPRAGLSWHYRCQHEELIAFSNHAMYGGDLLTIPSTASLTAKPAVRWIDVPDGAWVSGRNDPEARRVVDHLVEVFGAPSPPSTGVVTFNIQQRQAVLDEIDRRRAADAAFGAAWDRASTDERLDQRPFVKNLENVQGDERDLIVFSLAYAPVDRVSKRGTERVVPARFGPLGQRGGERRLNVAVSRAKKGYVIVSSFEPGMLSVARTTNDGPRLFKQFLEFSHHLAHGQRSLAARVLALVNEATDRPRSRAHVAVAPGYVPLKAQIALALQQRAMACEMDVGSSAFRVPLAVVHPGDPGRYAVAVICDEGGEEASAFERHVHRPATLRSRGWNTLQVTSREWARDPGRVLDAILARIEPLAALSAAEDRAEKAPRGFSDDMTDKLTSL